MLVATFGPSTGWAGKTITREGDVFTLEGHGPITAVDVMEYDRQGHLVWVDAGTRAWVGAKATSTPAPVLSTQPPEQRQVEPEAAKTKRRRVMVVGVLVGLIVVSLFALTVSRNKSSGEPAGGSSISTSTPTPLQYTVSGLIGAPKGTADIEGANIEIRDEKGSLVGAADASGDSGVSQYSTRVTFTATVPKCRFYSFEVGSRDGLSVSFDEMVKKNWEIVILIDM